MKYTTLAKAALGLALSVMIGTAQADSSLPVEESFEGFDNEDLITIDAAWTGGGDDISMVVEKNYSSEIAPPLAEAAHSKVLQLNTEGGTLTNSLPEAVDIDGQEVYIDTMVQFVVSEEFPVIDDRGVKVAVYAYADGEAAESTTNLVVYHRTVVNYGLVATNSIISDVEIDTDKWYRLTVKAESSSSEGGGRMQIWLDGKLVESENANTDDWSELYDEASPGGTWFFSAASIEPNEISSVQFKGTGYIDDLVVTRTQPTYEPGGFGSGFTVTQNVGDNGSSSEEETIVAVEEGPINITYTANDWYVIDYVKVDDVAESPLDSAKQHTVTLSEEATVDVAFTKMTTFGDADSTDIDWFISQGWGENDIAEDLPYDYATLAALGLGATNNNVSAAITITGIELEDGDVKVSVKVDRTLPISKINAQLVIYGWESLTDGSPAKIGAAVIGGDDNAVTYSPNLEEATYEFEFNAGDNQFFKAVIEEEVIAN